MMFILHFYTQTLSGYDQPSTTGEVGALTPADLKLMVFIIYFTAPLSVA